MNLPEPAADFDIDALRLPCDPLAAMGLAGPKRLPRHRPGTGFLRGPIPWDWLTLAARQPGKALQVAMVLWKECGCCKNRTVKFRLSQAVALGMHADTARRGLKALARAGLVTCRELPGKCLKVTLRDAPASAPDEG